MNTDCKPLFVSLVLLSACAPPSDEVGEVPGETEAATDTDSMPTEGTGAEESTAGAEESTGATEDTGDVEGGCLDESYECFSEIHEPLECGGAELCDLLQVNDPTLNEFDEEPFGFINPEAATCILEGLAAGTVGSYRIDVEPGQQFSDDYRLEVLTDGSVIVRKHSQQDKTCDGLEQRLELRPASDFEACAAETDEALQFECIVGAGNPEVCVDPGHVCPA